MKNKDIVKKYLSELYSNGDFPFPFCEKKYLGFDVRETYDYNNYFIYHLYIVLRYYQDEVIKIVDLNYHKIVIDDVEKTLLEWINKMIILCKIIIQEWDSYNEDQIVLENSIEELFKIMSKCFYYLWW